MWNLWNVNTSHTPIGLVQKEETGEMKLTQKTCRLHKTLTNLHISSLQGGMQTTNRILWNKYKNIQYVNVSLTERLKCLLSIHHDNMILFWGRISTLSYNGLLKWVTGLQFCSWIALATKQVTDQLEMEHFFGLYLSPEAVCLCMCVCIRACVRAAAAFSLILRHIVWHSQSTAHFPYSLAPLPTLPAPTEERNLLFVHTVQVIQPPADLLKQAGELAGLTL